MHDFDLRPSEGARERYRVESGAPVEWDEDPAAFETTGNGTRTPSPMQPSADASLTAPFRGPEGLHRVDAVRRALDDALVRWWHAGHLPPDGLLRDGLLVLEAGHPLDEAQRTLLARTALVRRRGITTALRHQTDPERVAGLLRETLHAGALSLDGLTRLLHETALDPTWTPYLAQELRVDLAAPDPQMVERAEAALRLLEREGAADPEAGAFVLTRSGSAGGRLRLLALVVLVALLAALWLYSRRTADFGDVIAVPAGAYTVSADADGAFSGQIQPRRVDLPAFVIDRTEVTNAQYRACYSAGACPWPAANHSATRTDYFLDPAFAAHPVLHVDWEGAERYCSWRGMRLPTPAEWEVAASFAPATARYYRFPWGETWQPELVVGGGGFTDTAPVGSRSPRGDSPLGAADMAGNVAEWTSSASTVDPGLVMVRGGSWRSSPDRLLPSALQLIRKSDASNSVGFRCAATP